MRPTEVCRAWVVYRMTLPKGAVAGNVVCEQWEWDALEAERPGYHTLLRAGLKTEQEAENLARGTAGDEYKQRRPRVPKAAPPLSSSPRSRPDARVQERRYCWLGAPPARSR